VELAERFRLIAYGADVQAALLQERVPKAVAQLNEGRIYVQARDCGAPRDTNVMRGTPVVFNLYWDEKGLGAMNVRHAVTLQALKSSPFVQLGREGSAEEQLATVAEAINTASIALVIPRAQCGMVIGEKGVTIKQIKADSGAKRIVVNNSGGDMRLVDIMAEPSVCANTAIMIGEKLRAPGEPLVVRLAVPREAFGRVVGKSKLHLTEIANKCGGVNLRPLTQLPIRFGQSEAIEVSDDDTSKAAVAVKFLVARIVSLAPEGDSSQAVPGPQGNIMGVYNFPGPVGFGRASAAQFPSAVGQKGAMVPFGHHGYSTGHGRIHR